MTLAVDPAHADGEWIRHAPHRSDLLGRAATPTDGRWQRGEHVPGLYLAADTATAVAEWYRFLAELGIPPSRAVPHDHHVWRLNLELADLASARQLASVGLPPPRPGRATWPPYQDVGEALWREGWAGLLAPSAARPRRKNRLHLRQPLAARALHADPRQRDHRNPATTPRNDDIATTRGPRSTRTGLGTDAAGSRAVTTL